MFKDCGPLPPANQEGSEAVTSISAKQMAASIVIDQSLDAILSDSNSILNGDILYERNLDIHLYFIKFCKTSVVE